MPKIRFHMITPLALYGQRPPKPLMLDGILGYAWALLNGYTKTPAELSPKNLVFPDLPLELIGDKCYAASAAFIPKGATLTPTKINRRADWASAMAKFGCADKLCETTKGWAQACLEPYWELLTPYVDFYYRGDKKGVTELLSVIYKIRFLGGKRAAGYGQIRSIEHFDDSPDWAAWRDDEPTRPIPVDIAGENKGLTPQWSTFYPPYWAAVNGAWCYLPPQSQWLPHSSNEDVSMELEKYFDGKIKALHDRMGVVPSDAT